MASNFDPRNIRSGAPQQIFYGAGQPQPVLHGGHSQHVLYGGAPPQPVSYNRGPAHSVPGMPAQQILYGAAPPQPVFQNTGPQQPVYYRGNPPQPVYHGGVAAQPVLPNAPQPMIQVCASPRPVRHDGTPSRPLHARQESPAMAGTVSSQSELNRIQLKKDDTPHIVVSHIDPDGIIWVQVCFVFFSLSATFFIIPDEVADIMCGCNFT